MSAGPVVCERCGDPLDQAYSTTAYSGIGQALRVGPDGAGVVLPLGGMVACSWNCLAVLAAQRAGSTGDAAVRIVAERERQVTEEGYSPERDASMPPGELAQAGVVYAAGAVVDAIRVSAAPPRVRTQTLDGDVHELGWPWDTEWWKPKSYERDLIRAGALIAAEADRDPSRRREPSGEPF